MRRLLAARSLLPLLSLLSLLALSGPARPVQASPVAAPGRARPLPAHPFAARPMPARPMPARRAPRGRRLDARSNRFGLGLSGGWSPGSGFAFRYYTGRTVLQGTLFAAVTDRGDSATVFAGLSMAHYLLVWHGSDRFGFLPDTSALRLTGSAAYLFRKRVDEIKTAKKDNSACVDKRTAKCPVTQKIVRRDKRQWDAFTGLGIGFEFGAVMSPGFSLSLDLILTAMFDDHGLYEILPVPAVGLLYNW